MPEYRRFIAYFYEYIDGKKQKNAGFAKVELRNGMWRILFRLTAASQPEPPVQVYGFVREKGYLLGLLMGTMRPGSEMMEEWAYKAEQPIWNGKYRLEDLAGIWVQSGDSRCYITVWDEEPVMAERFVLELPEGEERETGEPERRLDSEPEEGSDIGEFRMEDSSVRMGKAADEGYKADMETDRTVGVAADGMYEAGAEMDKTVSVTTDERYEADTEMDKNVSVSSGIEAVESPVMEDKEDTVQGYAGSPKTSGAVNDPEGQIDEVMAREGEKLWADRKGQSIIMEEAAVSVQEAETQRPSEKAFTERTPDTPQSADSALASGDFVAESDFSSCDSAPVGPSCPRRQSRRSQPFNQRRTLSKEQVWQELSRTRTHFQPFEDREFMHCIQIMPCDVMRLQQAGLQVGRSSFLLHGFYQYRHILLGIAGDGTWVIGVPGIQNAQERYMAQMFGFTQFKTARRPDQNRQFGYWCRGIGRIPGDAQESGKTEYTAST